MILAWGQRNSTVRQTRVSPDRRPTDWNSLLDLQPVWISTSGCSRQWTLFPEKIGEHLPTSGDCKEPSAVLTELGAGLREPEKALTRFFQTRNAQINKPYSLFAGTEISHLRGRTYTHTRSSSDFLERSASTAAGFLSRRCSLGGPLWPSPVCSAITPQCPPH
jgi:hypothetical protein